MVVNTTYVYEENNKYQRIGWRSIILDEFNKSILPICNLVLHTNSGTSISRRDSSQLRSAYFCRWSNQIDARTSSVLKILL